jgi:hypothetical protein
MSTLEPVSGQVGLCFPGKVIFGGRDRTAITSVEAPCEKSRDQVDPAEGANTGYLAPLPGNLCGAATDWWSNEDSNQGPGRFYRGRATGSVRDRDRGRAAVRRTSGARWFTEGFDTRDLKEAKVLLQELDTT